MPVPSVPDPEPDPGLALVMGVLNVTPDSFSDGGRFLDPEAAIAHGRALAAEGAHVIDVGGESTRPGADPVPVDEEIRRVVPVIEALAADGSVRLSIDTTKAEVARAAVAAGATLINDVGAGLDAVAADLDVGWIAMHRKGTPRTMQDAPAYDDVVTEVVEFLDARAAAGRARGVQEVWVDPGFGFGKTPAHNLALLHHLDRLVDRGWPVLVGTSRKMTLGRILAASDARGRVEPDPPAERLPELDLEGVDAPTDSADRIEASVATATWAFLQGVRMVRAHDVLATVQAAKVVAG